ncbi:MAG: hypothetical protein HY718_03070 [Planctomycetes bacterium]|nr:hypothetical protein [Planctomycetota bacterium]
MPRVPALERHVIAAGPSAGASLNLPDNRGFNVHIKQSSQDLGPAGEARGESLATPEGKALAAAEAAKGGSAKAEFKLGHRIDNHAGTAQMMTAEISFAINQNMEASAVPAPGTLAKANLYLVVIDSHKRVVSKTTLVQATTDDSVGSAASPQERHLTARLESGESYDVVLYGQVEAAAAADQTSSARIGVDQLKMALTFSAVTTRPAAPADS